MRPTRITHGLELFVGDGTARPLRPGGLVATLARGLSELPGHEEIGAPMPDSRLQPVPGWLWDLVEYIELLLAVGLPVLVRCRHGLNRSGLTAGVILRGFGWSGPQAVATIQDARGPKALANPYFRDLVLDWPHDPMA